NSVASSVIADNTTLQLLSPSYSRYTDMNQVNGLFNNTIKVEAKNIAKDKQALEQAINEVKNAKNTQDFNKAQEEEIQALSQLTNTEKSFEVAQNTLEQNLKDNWDSFPLYKIASQDSSIFNAYDRGIYNIYDGVYGYYGNLNNIINDIHADTKNLTSLMNHQLPQVGLNGANALANIQNKVDKAENALMNEEYQFNQAQKTLDKVIRRGDVRLPNVGINASAQDALNQANNVANVMASDNEGLAKDKPTYNKQTSLWSLDAEHKNTQEDANVVAKDKQALEKALNEVKSANSLTQFESAYQNEVQDMNRLDSAVKTFTSSQTNLQHLWNDYKDSMPLYSAAQNAKTIFNTTDSSLANSTNASVRSAYDKVAQDVYDLTNNTNGGVHELSLWMGNTAYNSNTKNEIANAKKALIKQEEQFSKDQQVLEEVAQKANMKDHFNEMSQKALKIAQEDANAVVADNTSLQSFSPSYSRYTDMNQVNGLFNNTIKVEAKNIAKDKQALEQAINEVKNAKNTQDFNKAQEEEIQALSQLTNTEKSFEVAQNTLEQNLKDNRKTESLYKVAMKDLAIYNAYDKGIYNVYDGVYGYFENIAKVMVNMVGSDFSGLNQLTWLVNKQLPQVGLNGANALANIQNKVDKAENALVNEERQFNQAQRALDKVIRRHIELPSVESNAFEMPTMPSKKEFESKHFEDNKMNDYLKEVRMNDSQDDADVDYSDRIDD
ncbi:hypothetical protein, partial [Helicobacter cetorum]|uniref:hypothetical protein n=1 Tax=Helicobacter cetorum TaxID=138563 RepID=UPI0013152288